MHGGQFLWIMENEQFRGDISLWTIVLIIINIVIELYFDEHFEFLDWPDNIYINDLTSIDEYTRLTNTIQRQSYITVSGTPFYGSHVGNVQIWLCLTVKGKECFSLPVLIFGSGVKRLMYTCSIQHGFFQNNHLHYLQNPYL